MTLFLYLDETYLGELAVGSVRGHETWMFAYDADYLKVPRPMLDPEIANVPGPQYSCPPKAPIRRPISANSGIGWCFRSWCAIRMIIFAITDSC